MEFLRSLSIYFIDGGGNDDAVGTLVRLTTLGEKYSPTLTILCPAVNPFQVVVIFNQVLLQYFGFSRYACDQFKLSKATRIRNLSLPENS